MIWQKEYPMTISIDFSAHFEIDKENQDGKKKNQEYRKHVKFEHNKK